MPVRVFAFDFSRWLRPLFLLIGAGPRWSGVALSDDALDVRMGVGFRGRFPRSSIRGAKRERNIWYAIGVHTNLRGSWLVNGSSRGIVSMEIEPPTRAWCLGFRVHVKRLGLGLEDPDGFLAALGDAAG